METAMHMDNLPLSLNGKTQGMFCSFFVLLFKVFGISKTNTTLFQELIENFKILCLLLEQIAFGINILYRFNYILSTEDKN